MTEQLLKGDRFTLRNDDANYPAKLRDLIHAPEQLYGIGNVDALSAPGIVIVGSRKMTPYGAACAQRFARIAAERGVAIVTGGARGVEASAIEAALEQGGTCVVVHGPGCDNPHPSENADLFQRVIDTGGVVVSEQTWDYPAIPHVFRARSRITVGLSNAVLAIEVGLPSGTFTTCDQAFAMGVDVLAVPGAITSPQSLGSNALIAAGAKTVFDDYSFIEALEHVGLIDGSL